MSSLDLLAAIQKALHGDSQWMAGDEWNLVQNGVLTEQQVLEAYHKATNIPIGDEDELTKLPDIENLNLNYLEDSHILPINLTEDILRLGISRPYQIDSIQSHFAALFNLKIEFRLYRQSILERAFLLHFDRLTVTNDDLDSPETLKNLASEAPIVRLVNDMFARALESGASDIHVEPGSQSLTIRFRIDGVLQTILSPPLNQFAAISSRLKLIGGLNIAEHRLPQDGRIELTIGKVKIDIRMSTLPGLHGESIVMRLLKKDIVDLTLPSIGMSPNLIKHFSALVNRPHGLFLVVGPTGSGKTTTLYCVLNLINNGQRKIITVEDPIEYQVDGITQVQVKPGIGLSFASGLRSILRQDPDIILVGEIRDRETADICINAALTGHLVFSTLHTNDAAGAISRLQEMGIENYLLASSLTGVLSQRLVRKICVDCRPSIEARKCKSCNSSGYRGRVGIFELLEVSDPIRKAIIQSADSHAIAQLALAQGMRLLRQDGEDKVSSGLTTTEELIRVCTNS